MRLVVLPSDSSHRDCRLTRRPGCALGSAWLHATLEARLRARDCQEPLERSTSAKRSAHHTDARSGARRSKRSIVAYYYRICIRLTVRDERPIAS